jgi:8-oxo-dGTP diphosphatase
MTPAPVTTNLLHDLVVGSHAQGVTSLAVASVIDHHGRILLVIEGGLDFIDNTWQLPTGPVHPGETLTDALPKTLAAIGLNLDETTGYLGHHDQDNTDGEITRVFCFAVTVTNPDALCRSTTISHRWTDPHDLSDPPAPALLHSTAPATAPPLTPPAPQDPPLATPLRACARGIHTAEASTELLINHATWLHRSDFRKRFLHTDTAITDDTELADIDWPAAITALDAGLLPCSGGEGRILRLAASIADGILVDLRNALTGLDSRNAHLVSQAVLHASGHRPAASPR